MSTIKEGNDCSEVMDLFLLDVIGKCDYISVPLRQGKLADVRRVEYNGGSLVLKGERLGYHPYDPIELEFRILSHLYKLNNVNVPRPIRHWTDGKYSIIAMEFIPGNTYLEVPVEQAIRDLPRMFDAMACAQKDLNNFFGLNPNEERFLKDVRGISVNKIIEKAAPYIRGILKHMGEIRLIYDQLEEEPSFYPDFRPSNFITNREGIWVLDFNLPSFGKPSESFPYFIDNSLFDGQRNKMIQGLCPNINDYHVAAVYVNIYNAYVVKRFNLGEDNLAYHLRCAAESSAILGKKGLAKTLNDAAGIC